jgi:hypothetical protein
VETGPLNAADRKAVQNLFARDRELEVVVVEGKGEMQKLKFQLKSKS